ncbi:MAG: hypothetical protein AB1442_14980 [Nitrospirota bacterium]
MASKESMSPRIRVDCPLGDGAMTFFCEEECFQEKLYRIFFCENENCRNGEYHCEFEVCQTKDCFNLDASHESKQKSAEV